MFRQDHPTTQLVSGTPITPSELVDLAEFATPHHLPTGSQLQYEADNLAEWCEDNPQLAGHAAMLARGRGARREVVAVLDELAAYVSPPPHRLAATA
jgi:hypothetical protein